MQEQTSKKKLPSISDILIILTLVWSKKKCQGNIVMTNHTFLLISILQGIIILWYIKDWGWTGSWEVIK